jgi:hypothetical protein
VAMILIKTHSNRWIARERLDRPVLGRVTRIGAVQMPTNYRTELLAPATVKRVLLRDAGSLEVAFALLIAAIARSQMANEARGSAASKGLIMPAVYSFHALSVGTIMAEAIRRDVEMRVE